MAIPADYHRAAVKIELSGRAEGWPMEDRLITPYVAQQFPSIDPETTLLVSSVRPERTFSGKGCAGTRAEHPSRGQAIGPTSSAASI
jgi:hypothetical protein